MGITPNKVSLKTLLCASAGFFVLAGCSTAQSAEGSLSAQEAAIVTSTQTQQSSGEMEAGVLVLGNNDTQEPTIISATGLNGLETFSIDGTSQGSTESGEIIALDVAYNFQLGNKPITLIGAIDQKSDSLRLYESKGSSLIEIGAGSEGIDFAAENVCFYRHALDSSLYAFIVGDGGQVHQNLVYETDNGKVSIRSVRQINVPSTIKQCVADETTGTLYVSEEEVGIWKFNGDPEATTGAQLIDSPNLGHIDEEVGGLAVYNGGENANFLFASNLGAGTVNVYDIEDNTKFLGSIKVSGENGDPISEPGQLYATSYPVGSNNKSGLLLVADEDIAAVRMVDVASISSFIGRTNLVNNDPRSMPERSIVPIMPTVETTSVNSFGDAADDPVIWANEADPNASLVIATDKQSGLYVHGMDGKVVQYLPDGKMNNVDLRNGFSLSGKQTTIVTASDRTHGTIAIYALDPINGKLTNVANGPQPTELNDPYGLCMYRNPESGRTYVFINGDETRKRQWELTDAGNGKVDATLVRDLSFNSQTEGCVADDATGTLYVGEEDIGIWKLSAEPESKAPMSSMDTIENNKFLFEDVEGMSIYHLDSGGGYLVASSQGNDTYVVYDLETNGYLGAFAVVANSKFGIDGASETDGLDVSSANLGAGFEHGALVVQDGRNVMPSENQNYKYVPWQSIASALGLEMN